MENDKNIKIVYVCGVCGKQYYKIENCQACVKSHEDEKKCLVVELGMKIGNGRLQNYGFCQRSFAIRPGDAPKCEVDCHGLYGGYPHFFTECLDTPMELLKAQSRLLKAASEWCFGYSTKLKEMLLELEQGGEARE